MMRCGMMALTWVVHTSGEHMIIVMTMGAGKRASATGFPKSMTAILQRPAKSSARWIVWSDLDEVARKQSALQGR